jgi:biotin carboxyl carrier protein
MMKRRKRTFFIAGLAAAALISGCAPRAGQEEKEVEARIPVTTAQIRHGDVSSYLDLTASSSFLNKAFVKSPAAAYIEEMKILPGDAVKKGETLFTLRTKEGEILKGDSASHMGFSGLITVKASIDGMLTTVDHARGDYVSEGDQLATIVIPSSLVFILDVPFESTGFVHTGSTCDLTLPDNRVIRGTVTNRLSSVNASSQTQRFTLRPEGASGIPENLIAKVRIPKNKVKDAVLLDKSCILSDEVMQHFWVMKLVSDSVAVKVPVTLGLTDNTAAQILDPAFSDSDRFLSSGNYGVGDTVKVILTGKK